VGLSAWWRLTRPFTLLPPALGVLSGSLIALGAENGAHWWRAGLTHALPITLGCLSGAVLNAASNVLNQAQEVELDRHNKPERPLVRGDISIRAAQLGGVVLYAVAVLVALAVPLLGGTWAFPACVTLAALATVAYSVQPCYLKGRGFWANVTIAVPRGLLLKVAGWACVASVWGTWEPWWIGMVFFLFLCTAASTKDLADEAGDRLAGARTWVVAAGRERVLRAMQIGFVIPWPLIPIGTLITQDGHPVLAIAPLPAAVFAIVLMAYGYWIAHQMRHESSGASIDANHRSWTHMYLLMMLSQFGLAALYLFARASAPA
jgi:geranylgeranylglycerol-phosphate geranylgeranyltransferase